MKHRIKQILSLGLAISMLLSLIPLYGAAMIDEFEGLETVEEIPFEFVLEPGDLTHELLREAVLAPEDLPSCIDPELAEARGHVNRLYLQEPDNRTVMFQNRDGSKTVYLFSHPVKGMSASTVSSFEISGTRLSFTFSNAITSRVGVTLSNFNIGYAEVAYIPGGVLTEDGVNITEDVRDWARGESTVSALAYNISGEAAAEYAASVAVPDTDVAATAAAAPGITITPNDPAPLGGMTVMSISYSDLAGLMSFKNTVTNKYLTLDASSTTLSTSTSRLPLEYSQWAVQYDSFFGYVISSISNPYNTYLGYDDTERFIIDSLSYVMYNFEPVVVSTTDATVNISCSLSAIDSDGEPYELSPDESEYPNSCVWKIMNKRTLRLVTSISAPTTIVEQSGVSFIYSDRYSFPQPYPTYYEMELYDATTNQPFEFDTKIYEDDDYWCTVDTPGDYTVYFKDEVTRIKSPNFTLTVVDHIIIPESDVRIEQKNVGFTLDYTFYPGASTYSNVKLYYADTNTEVPHTGDTYTIPTAGVYSVYYKDSVSGVTSVEFMLIVVDSMEVYESNITYSIRSYITSQNSEDLYLSVNSSTGLELTTKDLDSRTVVRDTGSDTILCERLANISRTFTFKHSVDSCDILSGVYITATMSTSQYTGLPNRSLVESNSYNGNYYLTNKDTIANTIKYIEDSGPSLTTMNQGGTPFVLLDMGDYYLIAIAQYLTSASPVIMALKASGNSMVVEEYTPDSTDANAFKWYIDQIGVDVPLMKQTGSVWCGPTSYLQVLLGKSENVVGNRYNTTLNFQQSTIKATFTDFVEGAGVFIPNQSFANGINNGDYIPEGYVCHELEVTNSVTQDTIYNNITNSLRKGMACMFMTSTGKPPYKQTYNGNGHIICIMGYDPSSNTILISNCHYWDSTDDTYGVFGIFEIDFEDFCEDVGHLWYFTCTEQSEGEQP